MIRPHIHRVRGEPGGDRIVSTTIKKFSFEIIVSLLFVFLIALYVAFPQVGKAEAETADVLAERVLKLYDAGNYAEAVPLAQKVIKIRETTQGPEHPDVATALQTLAGIYQAAGDYAQAAPLDRRALTILKKLEASALEIAPAS